MSALLYFVLFREQRRNRILPTFPEASVLPDIIISGIVTHLCVCGADSHLIKLRPFGRATGKYPQIKKTCGFIIKGMNI